MNELIIFEGSDGSGKTTQIQKIKEYLEAAGIKVIVTREPGGTPLGDQIREIVLNSDHIIDPVTEAYLYATSRSALNHQIKEWVDEGYTVLCDRHLLSSIVLQNTNYVEKINAAAMIPLNYISKTALYFDITYETFKKRSDERLNSRGLDNIESRYVNEYETKKMLKKYADRATAMGAIFIDANKDIPSIFEQIIKIL